MPTEDQNNPVSVELTRHASSSGRGRGSGFRGRGRGRGGGGFGAVRRNSGSLAQPGHGQNKEEQMESYWQDVEKTWFTPPPPILSEAIDRNISVGLEFLQACNKLYGDHLQAQSTQVASFTPIVQSTPNCSTTHPGLTFPVPPSPSVNFNQLVQHNHLENSQQSQQSLIPPSNTASASVIITPDDHGRDEPFCGPWQYLIAQSYLADLFGANGEYMRPEMAMKLFTSSNPSIDLKNLDIFVCSSLGVPLSDRLNSTQLNVIDKHLQNQNKEKKSSKSGFLFLDGERPTPGGLLSDETRLCSLKFLMQAFGLTHSQQARTSSSSATTIQSSMASLEQTFTELQATIHNEIWGFPMIKPRGNPDAVRMLVSFPLSGYRLSDYPKDFVNRVKNVKDWPELLQCLMAAHFEHRQPRKLAACPTVSSIETNNNEDRDRVKHHHCHQIDIPTIFRLPRALIGPQPLWENRKATPSEIHRFKRDRPEEFNIQDEAIVATKRLKHFQADDVSAQSSLLTVTSTSFPPLPPGSGYTTSNGHLKQQITPLPSESISVLSTPPNQPYWSMLPNIASRQFTTIDGIELESNPLLTFQGPPMYRSMLLGSTLLDQQIDSCDSENTDQLPQDKLNRIDPLKDQSLSEMDNTSSQQQSNIFPSYHGYNHLHIPNTSTSSSSVNFRFHNQPLPLPTSSQSSVHPPESTSPFSDNICEFDQEHLYLLKHLESIEQTKVALLQKLKARMKAKLEPNETLWKETERKMVQLYRKEFFSHSLSGRHSYSLGREYKDLDFMRIFVPNGTELPRWWSEQALCCVCGVGAIYDDDPIIFCDACFLPVHHMCAAFNNGAPFPGHLDIPELGKFGSASREQTIIDNAYCSERPVAPRSPAKLHTAERMSTSYLSPKLKPNKKLLQQVHDSTISPNKEASGCSESVISPTISSEIVKVSDCEETDVNYHSLPSQSRKVVGRNIRSLSVEKSDNLEFQEDDKMKDEDMEGQDSIVKTEEVDAKLMSNEIHSINDEKLSNKNQRNMINMIKTNQSIDDSFLKEDSLDQFGIVEEEEWFCHCCQMIIHQVGDLPTAIVVIRHLAGPRTPQEFQEVLSHEKAKDLPTKLNWYLPLLLNEQNQPIVLKEYLNVSAASHKVITPSNSDTKTLRKIPSLKDKRKTSLKNGVKESSPSPTQKPTGSERISSLTRTSIKSNETSGLYNANDTTAISLESSSRGKARGKKCRGLRQKGRGTVVGRGKGSVEKPSRISVAELSSVNSTIVSYPNEDLRCEKSVPEEVTSAEVVQKEMVIAPQANVLSKRRQYFSVLHTKSATHWYKWKVTIEKHEIEHCIKSLNKGGIRHRQKRENNADISPHVEGQPSEEVRENIELKSKQNKIHTRHSTGPLESVIDSFRQNHKIRREYCISGSSFSLIEKSSQNVNESTGKRYSKRNSNDLEIEPTMEFIIRVPCCALCGYDPYFDGGGIMKKGISARKRREFAHIRCALGIDGTVAPDALRYTVEPERNNLRCSFCYQKGPAPVQCGHEKCPKPYHVSCGTQALECVSEFVELRPVIYCNFHSREKPPTQVGDDTDDTDETLVQSLPPDFLQALRLYQQSIERTKRLRKRTEEERAAFSSSPECLSSFFLRSLVSAHNISAESLDVLFPHSLVPLLYATPPQAEHDASQEQDPVNQAPEDVVVGDVVPPSSNSGSGPTGFVIKSRNRTSKPSSSSGLSLSILSPSVLSRCPNGVSDVLGRQQRSRYGASRINGVATDSTENPTKVDEGNPNWSSSTVDFSSAVRLSGSSYGIMDSSLWQCSGLFCGSLKDRRSMKPSSMSEELESNKHLIGINEMKDSYRLYQTKVGSFGVQCLMDSAIRLFIYLKGGVPDQHDFKNLSNSIYSTARCWDLCGLQWVVQSTIEPTAYDVPGSRWQPNIKNLSRAINSSSSLEEVFDQWYCSACGRNVQVWTASTGSAEDFFEGIETTPEVLPSIAFRCTCCGCCICSNCCLTHCNLDHSTEINSTLGLSPSDHPIPQVADGGMKKSNSIVIPSRIAPRKSRSLSSSTKKLRVRDSTLNEEDGEDSGSAVQLQKLMDIVTSIVNSRQLLCPRCEFFFWKPLKKSGGSHQNGIPPHPSLLGACVLCNRCDGFLIQRIGFSFGLGESIIPVSSPSFSSVAHTVTPVPMEKYDQTSGPHWVHPCCAEWFVTARLKGSGARCVGRILKKYGCRPGGYQDNSFTQTSVAVANPEICLSCMFCGFSVGAVWTCSSPKCNNVFHVSCGRLCGCKFEQQIRKPASSLHFNPQQLPRRAYCSEHSFSLFQLGQIWSKDNELINWLTSLAVTASSWCSSFPQLMWSRLTGKEPVDLALQITQSFVSGVGCIPLVFPGGIPSTVSLDWTLDRGSLGSLDILKLKCRTKLQVPLKKKKRVLDDEGTSSDEEFVKSLIVSMEDVASQRGGGKSLAVLVQSQGGCLEELVSRDATLGQSRAKRSLQDDSLIIDENTNEIPNQSIVLSSDEEDHEMEPCESNSVQEVKLSKIVSGRDAWYSDNQLRTFGRRPKDKISSDRIMDSPDRKRHIDHFTDEFFLPPKKKRSISPIDPESITTTRPRGRPRKHPLSESVPKPKFKKQKDESQTLQRHEEETSEPKNVVRSSTPPMTLPQQRIQQPIYRFPYPPVQSIYGLRPQLRIPSGAFWFAAPTHPAQLQANAVGLPITPFDGQFRTPGPPMMMERIPQFYQTPMVFPRGPILGQATPVGSITSSRSSRSTTRNRHMKSSFSVVLDTSDTNATPDVLYTPTPPNQSSSLSSTTSTIARTHLKGNVKQKSRKTMKRRTIGKDRSASLEFIRDHDIGWCYEEYWCGICEDMYDEFDGQNWIGCDECDKWFHWFCASITVQPPEDIPWFCGDCR